MIQKLLNTILNDRHNQRKADLYRDLIRHEARIGGQVFGPIPAGHRREFFRLDDHSWIWHEEWKDQSGKTQIRTTRYDVRPDGVLKFQNGQYQRISRQEALRFRQAVELYVERVDREMYANIT